MEPVLLRQDVCSRWIKCYTEIPNKRIGGFQRMQALIYGSVFLASDWLCSVKGRSHYAWITMTPFTLGTDARIHAYSVNGASGLNDVDYNAHVRILSRVHLARTSPTGSIDSPLTSSITPSLFHFRLKTFLFCKSFEPFFFSLGLTPRIPRTV